MHQMHFYFDISKKFMVNNESLLRRKFSRGAVEKKVFGL